MSREGYVPAAGRARLTAAYDLGMALTMRERSWRPLLVDRLRREAGPTDTVVEVGAGTGTLALMIAEALPSAAVNANDGDPVVLDIAAGKPGAERVELKQGLAAELDLPDGSADAVVLSLLLHHLVPGEKRRALAEARRIVRPDGRLLIADWGRPSRRVAPGFLALRILDGFEVTRDHLEGRIPELIRAAGFDAVETFERLDTVWGTLELIEARS